MREALISDVHAKPERLYATLKSLKSHGYDRVRCLGDVAGDKKDDERNTHECVDAITKVCDAWILGNHDELAGMASRFKTPCVKEFIYGAQSIIREPNVVYAHAQPSYSSKSYVLTPEDAQPIFARNPEKTILIGHTHIPAAISSAGDFVTFEKSGSISLDRRFKWMLNPGAIGKSRDRNPAPSCAIYDSEKATFTVVRI
jgi:predicted phosphodiesterase